jgi:hypothetical protein
MNIQVKKITDLDLIKDMIEFSDPNVSKSKIILDTAYKRGHSFIRSQLFYIKMEGIPTFVSVHLVRHAAVGQYHYVSSRRDDWTGLNGEEVNRNTPVNHVMILNAEHLIDMAKARLCSKSHKVTSDIMYLICEKIREIDPDLYNFMKPKCYWNGFCRESKPCGKYHKGVEWREEYYGEI